MFQFVIVAVGFFAGISHATSEDIGNVTLFLSRNISTVEGDVYSVNIETDTTEGRDIVHSTMNGNDSQTVITDHKLNIRVVIPDSESEDCHFSELDDEEKKEPSLEEGIEGVTTTMDSAVSENVNATDEKACLYEDDDPVMTEKLKATLTSLCGPRKIRHLTRKAECQDVPQEGGHQGETEETGSDVLARQKRWWCPFRVFWVYRRVTICSYRRIHFLFFSWWKKCCYTFTHCYPVYIRYCYG